MNPLRIGTDEEFRGARQSLVSCGYTEAAVCARLGLKKISEFPIQAKQRELVEELPDSVAVLTRLFLEAGCARCDEVRSHLGDAAVARLCALGLLAPLASDASLCWATVLMYPTRGLWIVSDRHTSPDGSDLTPPEDIVYPAIIPNTDLFLDLLPSDSCDAFLDLCSGTAVAALAARYARRSWAFDITERSTWFGEFNRRLNGVENAVVARGDLYEPAGDLTFDRIVAHPPYVPVLKRRWIFDAGGEDGEQVTRRIVEGLPRYLRPGGRFYSLTMGTDREAPFEERLREWLGARSAEFDVAFVNRRTVDPADYAARAVARRSGAPGDFEQWQAMFRERKIRALVYGFVMIQRRDSVRPAFTVRRQNGPATSQPEHEWLLGWETAAAADDSVDRIMRSRFKTAPACQLHVLNRMTEAEWTPVSYGLQTDYPFRMEMQAQPATVYLLTCCDGARTGDQLLVEMKSAGALHPDTSPAEFADLVRTLVSGGFVLMEGFALPR